jgi:hypothetical protein
MSIHRRYGKVQFAWPFSIFPNVKENFSDENITAAKETIRITTRKTPT